MEQINAEGTAVDSTPTAVRNAFVANKMCPSADQIRGLRFQLKRASALVVPTDFAVVQSNEVAASVFQSLSSLSTQTAFTVYYAHKSEPEASMATLCHLARIGRLKSTADEYSLERLYHGRGGTPYPFPERRGDAADPLGVDSPPSYDEIGLSPPPPAESSKRARGSESPTPSAAKKPKPSGAARMNQFEQQLAAMGARIASLEQARGASAPAAAAPTVESLRADLEALVAERCDAGVRRLRAELVEEMERRVEERVDELADERIDARLEELKDELAGEVDERVDDRLLDLKCDAQEFVREQFEDVEAQLKSKIAQAQVTIEFADEL
ncbi:hypothetical protein UCRNP2_7630 [Neofusicoccum parvum UCRNP2]|uniref:Uncharacterized protein n=1 Tax=Botryosphaeria parva (strain UCR-NP2) TaxID=1287680 RepID=R1G2K7_BOTPV|nr:hypothetical protein UCRNP2_7630 [Neofusicoccum parvum UCRNP2]